MRHVGDPMSEKDRKALDRALVAFWRRDDDGGGPPEGGWKNYGTNAAELIHQLDSVLGWLIEKRAALSRPFARGSAAKLAAYEPELSERFKGHCVGDLLEDLIDAGLAIRAARRKPKRRRKG